MIDFLNDEETTEEVKPVQKETGPQKYKYVNLSGTILWTDAGKVFPNQVSGKTAHSRDFPGNCISG